MSSATRHDLKSVRWSRHHSRLFSQAQLCHWSTHHPNRSQCRVTLLFPAPTILATACLISCIRPSGPHAATIIESLHSVPSTISLILAAVAGRPRIIGILEFNKDTGRMWAATSFLASPLSISISASVFDGANEGFSEFAGVWIPSSSESLSIVNLELIEAEGRVTWIVRRTSVEAFNSASSLANHDCCSVGKN